MASLILRAFTCSHNFEVIGHGKARELNSRVSIDYLFASILGVFMNHFVVEGVEHTSCNIVPDKVVVNTSVAIITVHKFLRQQLMMRFSRRTEIGEECR
jgi:hypothetical protein